MPIARPKIRRRKTQQSFWKRAEDRIVGFCCDWADSVVDLCLYLDFSGFMSSQHRPSRRARLGICVVFFGVGFGLVMLASVLFDAIWVKRIPYMASATYAKLFGPSAMNQERIRSSPILIRKRYLQQVQLA